MLCKNCEATDHTRARGSNNACAAAAGRTCIIRCCSQRGTRPGLCASMCCTAASSSAVARCRFSSTSGLFLLHQGKERRGAGWGRERQGAVGQHWQQNAWQASTGGGRRAGAAECQSGGLTLASKSCCRRRYGYYCWALVALPPSPDRRRGGKWKGLCRSGRAPTAGVFCACYPSCPNASSMVPVSKCGATKDWANPPSMARDHLCAAHSSLPTLAVRVAACPT